MATTRLSRIKRGWSALNERQIQYIVRLVDASIAEQDGHATPAQKRLNARIRRKWAWKYPNKGPFKHPGQPKAAAK